MVRWLIYGLGLYTLYSFTRGKVQEIKNALHFGATNIRVLESSLDKTELQIDQEIKNESPISFPADEFNGYLFYKDHNIGPIHIPQPVSVKSGEVTTVPIRVTVPHKQLAGNLLSLIQTGNIGNGQFKIVGNVTYKGVTIPIEQPIEI